ncbi:hypothetical protein JCM9279_004235 [Rhodotorula babjevae]
MATRTLSDNPPLLYALPLSPPIPFPLHPTYPVQLPTRDLRQAYLDTLWPPATAANHSEQARLESFARLLLTLLAERPPPALNSLVRDLVLPLQDFDKRWRAQIPPLVEDPHSSDDEDGRAPVGVSDDEATRARNDFEQWAVDEKARLEAKRDEDERRRKGKQRAVDQDAPAGAGDEHDEDSGAPKPVEVRPSGWLGDKELLETRLQALLLFNLLALPVTFHPDIPKKGRKKKNPEHFADTLDAAMLLDFLTDRMQIWRVMQDVSDLAFAVDVPLVEKEAKVKFVPVEERDAVQVWWADVVEPLYRNRIDASVLSHHRLKLFPAATSQADRLAQRLEPAPSPFKARSLLSLEKSARRREVREGERRVAESPTMKRLMSMSGLTGKVKERDAGRASAAVGSSAAAAASAAGRSQDEQGGGDVFKLPSKPSRRQDALDGGAAPADAAASRPRLPRKQERPRPLPRGDSSSAGIPDALKRRVVSLGKQAGSRSKSAVGAPLVKDGDGDAHKRKRKSLSPKKLTASERAAHTLTLVPDTPDKAAAAASSAASFRNPFHRTSSVPSFAALGAAFRAGAADAAPLPFSLAPPPRLGASKDQMDWSGEGEESDSEEDSEGDIVLGERDRRRGGAAGEVQEGATVTPKKQTARQVLVPDT